MAIRIEARMARIPRLHPNNDPNVDPNRGEYGRSTENATRIMARMSTRIGTNMAECPENTTELPEFSTEALDFSQLLTRIIAELKKKHDFPGGVCGCAGAVFRPIRLTRLYSALYSDGNSD